jgi:hypothetical protein
VEYEPFWSCNGMGRRSCRGAGPNTDGAGHVMQEEPGDTGSGERTKHRILRVWVAGFSGGLGRGFAHYGQATVPAFTLKLSNAMATSGGAVGDGVAKSIVNPVGVFGAGAEPIVPCES